VKKQIYTEWTTKKPPLFTLGAFKKRDERRRERLSDMKKGQKNSPLSSPHCEVKGLSCHLKKKTDLT
jgi:hypothetical protein